MKKFFCLLSLLLNIGHIHAQQLLSPKQFLGYDLGEKFTRHHDVVGYFKHVSEFSSSVKVETYGKSYEGRPLIYAVISSPENIKNLEQIRVDNLKKAGLEQGTASATKTAIVWLSYNVHGDEANSTESSMLTLHKLASDKEVGSWLKNTIVIIDPCLNPDGRERYTNFYYQYGNQPYNPNGDAVEHHEPWPGGRPNHYLFDLNRDWAWATQVETQQRLKIYQQWLPHVHADFHEQNYNDPYFFAPAAEPLHEVISPWQREFQNMIGKNNAKHFDKNGWLYFTKEIFDLYYPSYGDTYPTYNGAIGLTYEQAGMGYAGIGITTETGDELTLRDRILHHHTSALSTIEITSTHAARVVDEFEKYFQENINSPSAAYKSYVVRAGNNPDKIKKLIRWLDVHGIQYGHAAGKSTRGFDFQKQISTNVTIAAEDLVISANQPKSRFLTTIFEPSSKLQDSLTYDITAWNLMYAYDLQAFAIAEKIPIAKKYQFEKVEDPKMPPSPYAYIARYQHTEDVRFLTSLLKKNVRVRASEKSFTIGSASFEPGTLIITRRNNEHIQNFDSLVISLARLSARQLYTTSTGFVEKGKDFGSGELNLIRAPKIAVLFGEQTSFLSSGEIWHFFEQQIGYPITQIGSDYFKHADLNKYNVLIVPDGYYRMFEDALLEQISSWVTAGGRLILIGNSINAFTDRKIFSIRKYATDDERTEAQKKQRELKEREGFTRYEDVERKQVSDMITGAIYKITLDNSHPLGFGLGKEYYSLKTNNLRFAFLEGGWNVGIIKGRATVVQGFTGYRMKSSLDNSLIFGVENAGKGEIVYLTDNPLFRAFWENGKLLFSNAVFMVGQ